MRYKLAKRRAKKVRSVEKSDLKKQNIFKDEENCEIVQT